MEQLLPEVGTHHLPAAFPLRRLMVLIIVPALCLVKGHEQQCEFSPVGQLFGQGAVATHQQRPNQASVDVPFLWDSTDIFIPQKQKYVY